MAASATVEPITPPLGIPEIAPDDLDVWLLVQAQIMITARALCSVHCRESPGNGIGCGACSAARDDGWLRLAFRLHHKRTHPDREARP